MKALGAKNISFLLFPRAKIERNEWNLMFHHKGFEASIVYEHSNTQYSVG
jgi:hypothetical protein